MTKKRFSQKQEHLVPAAALMSISLLLILGSSHSAKAAYAIRDTVLGGTIVSAGDDLEVEILGSNADFDSEIRLRISTTASSETRIIGTNRQTGKIVHLGRIAPGVLLQFEIFVPGTGDSFVMGEGVGNPDGLPHAIVESLSPARTKVSFEDIFGGGDGDFDDAIIEIRSIPLIFIPGIAGSNLYDVGNVYTEDGANFWLGHYFTDHRQLTLDPDKGQLSIIATDVLRTEEIDLPGPVNKTEVVYQPLLDMLSSRGGYREYLVDDLSSRRTSTGCDLSQTKDRRPTLFVFAYDWRRDNSENATALKEYVDCIRQFHQNVRVNILAHSMGGIIARRYILDNPGQVKNLITIGTPWLGAPKIINTLETGEFLDGFFSFVLVLDSTIKDLLEFFPGAHQLLPSEGYFKLGGAPFREEGWDINRNGVKTEDLTSGELVTFLDRRYPRSTPGTTGLDFHSYPGQDDWSSDVSQVRYHHIVGIGEYSDTIGQIRAKPKTDCGFLGLGKCKRTFTLDLGFTAGDRTVPRISAERLAVVGSELVDLNQPDAELTQFFAAINTTGKVDHSGLTENPDVHDKIISALLSSDPLGSPIKAPIAPNQHPQLRPSYYLTISGAQSIAVTDSNGNTARSVEDQPHNSLPNATLYTVGENAALIRMSTNETFRVTFRSGSDPMSVELIKGVDNDTPTDVIRYRDLALPAGILAELEITPQKADALRFDSDGDGVVDSVLTPTVSATSPDALDITPPTVTFHVSHELGDTRVSISARDSGTGLKSVSYSLDGSQFQAFESIFSIDPAQTPILYAFADDNVANRSSVEFPVSLFACPSDINVVTAPGEAFVAVDYPPPIVNDPRTTTVRFSPPSGSVFLVGKTPVTFTAIDSSGNTFACTFTVTVTRPVLALSCPGGVRVAVVEGQPSGVVSYPSPALNRPEGASVVCSPPSGSSFPVGVTIVACTATNTLGETAACTFAVNVVEQPSVDICLRDDSSGNMLKFNSPTGVYQFTVCNGVTLSGTGIVTIHGGVITLQDYASDHRVLASVDTTVKKGTATIQLFSPATTFTIADRNIENNSCACP